MTHRCLASWVAAALALVWAPAAHASPTFPGEVQSTLGMPCAPPCVICHATSLGGIGTAVRPFGLAVHAHGAHAGDTAGLRRALGLLEAGGVDSNHDGVGDVVELREGRNPNDGTGLCGLQYGCAVSAAPPRMPHRYGDGLVTLAVLIGLLARAKVLPRSYRGRRSR